MALKNFRNLFLYISLMSVMLTSGAIIANADENGEPTSKSKAQECDDFDRDEVSENVDVEKTYGGCPGNAPTPEPVSILLFSAGIAGVGFAARRRLRRQNRNRQRI